MVKGNNKTASKEYTPEEVSAATKDSYGIISRVAINLGCTWGTARKYIDLYDEAKALFLEESERVLDVAETKVIQAINANDIQTAKWLLATKGKNRGYSERVEHSGPDGSAIPVEQTVIQIKFRKGESKPTESADHATTKGKRKSG